MFVPGLSHWIRARVQIMGKAKKGQPYIVLTDESLFEFFQLNTLTGYFCHAAVVIPEHEYASFGIELKPVFEQYRALTGSSQTEFKYAEFQRLISNFAINSAVCHEGYAACFI
jgi:hypothetical protein